MTQRIPQYLRDHAQHLEKRSIFLADCTMRYGSAEGLTLLSLIATKGRTGYEGLLIEVRALLAAGTPQGLPPLDTITLAWIARVKAGQPGPDLDFSEAADLAQAVRVLRPGQRLVKGKGLPGDTDRLVAQTNIAAGRLDYVRRVLPDLVLADESRWMLETELLNPSHGGDEGTWMSRFNWIFENSGLAPIALASGDGTPFDRVVPARTPVALDVAGPLVTVIMSVFKADQSLFTALRSLSAQTWPHLQVLVVDDRSPDEFLPLIEEAVGLDDRFELHRMRENGGTYRIRNFAIARAAGDFITFQDSDDWSHPERIERQLRPLLDDQDLVATMSRSVRVFSDLSASKMGYAPLRRNVSSLFLRKDRVMSDLGGFDETRKSADSEFLERMELHYDAAQIRTLDEALALVQLTTGSLSRADFQFGWRDGNRVAYRQAFEYWHQQIARGEEGVRLEPGSSRRFPAPPALLGTSTGALGECDVLVVNDWRDELPRYAGAEDEVRALQRAGVTTALLHAETMRFAQRPRLAPSDAMMQMQADGIATFARWEEPLAARIALVRDPELLCYPRRTDTLAITAESVVIHAAYPPRSPENGSYIYDPVAVEKNAATLLGHEPVWLPATAEIAQALSADGARGAIAEPGHLGIVRGHRRAHAGVRGQRPIVGVTGLERFPTRDRPGVHDLRRLLPDTDGYDVRILDARGAIAPEQRQDLPANWLLSRDTMIEDFVDQLDVLVCIPRRTWGPTLTREAALAAGRGCLLIVPPAYAQYFDDAAICAHETEIAGVIDSVWKDPDRFDAQQQRGYAWAESALTDHAFLGLLASASGLSLVDLKESS
jgi:hypothetical protein